MLVTEMDEPLHVLISASNEETLNDPLERVNSVFTQADLAGRLAQKSTVCNLDLLIDRNWRKLLQ